jgi:hypothetical protein
MKTQFPTKSVQARVAFSVTVAAGDAFMELSDRPTFLRNGRDLYALLVR